MLLMSCFWANFTAMLISLMAFCVMIFLVLLVVSVVETYVEWLYDRDYSVALFFVAPLALLILIGVPLIAAIVNCP